MTDKMILTEIKQEADKASNKSRNNMSADLCSWWDGYESGLKYALSKLTEQRV